MKYFIAQAIKIHSDNIPTASGDSIFNGVVNSVFAVAGMVAVIGVVISAYIYVTSNGDSSKITKGKQGLIYSIVGLAVVSVGFALIRFVVVAITR